MHHHTFTWFTMIVHNGDKDLRVPYGCCGVLRLLDPFSRVYMIGGSALRRIFESILLLFTRNSIASYRLHEGAFLSACDTAKFDRKGFCAKFPIVSMLSGVLRRSSATFLITICSCENAQNTPPVRAADDSALGRVAWAITMATLIYLLNERTR